MRLPGDRVTTPHTKVRNVAHGSPKLTLKPESVELQRAMSDSSSVKAKEMSYHVTNGTKLFPKTPIL